VEGETGSGEGRLAAVAGRLHFTEPPVVSQGPFNRSITGSWLNGGPKGPEPGTRGHWEGGGNEGEMSTVARGAEASAGEQVGCSWQWR
jgi:hypothetical protein